MLDTLRAELKPREDETIKLINMAYGRPDFDVEARNEARNQLCLDILSRWREYLKILVLSFMNGGDRPMRQRYTYYFGDNTRTHRQRLEGEPYNYKSDEIEKIALDIVCGYAFEEVFAKHGLASYGVEYFYVSSDHRKKEEVEEHVTKKLTAFTIEGVSKNASSLIKTAVRLPALYDAVSDRLGGQFEYPYYVDFATNMKRLESLTKKLRNQEFKDLDPTDQNMIKKLNWHVLWCLAGSEPDPPVFEALSSWIYRKLFFFYIRFMANNDTSPFMLSMKRKEPRAIGSRGVGFQGREAESDLGETSDAGIDPDRTVKAMIGGHQPVIVRFGWIGDEDGDEEFDYPSPGGGLERFFDVELRSVTIKVWEDFRQLDREKCKECLELRKYGGAGQDSYEDLMRTKAKFQPRVVLPGLKGGTAYECRFDGDKKNIYDKAKGRVLTSDEARKRTYDILRKRKERNLDATIKILAKHVPPEIIATITKRRGKKSDLEGGKR